MAFGNGFKHEDSVEMLEAGNYKAKIKSAEIKNGTYGDYIQAEVEVEGHPGCNPHIFLINDRPTSGFGSMTVEQAQKMWDRNMTQFFASFAIPEGDFEPSHWVGKVGEITVQQQKKNPQYNEILPYKTKPRKTEKKEVTTHTDSNNADGFKEDIPDDIMF
jgi:hypothetical protein